MENINDILGALSPEDIDDLKSLAKDLFSAEGNNAPTLGDINLGALGELLHGGEDSRTALIQALKPLLSEQRQKRADEAVRLMKLASLLPTLQQSGILEKLLGGDNGLL